MISSLLVPLDGSQLAEHALPLALAIARRAGAKPGASLRLYARPARGFRTRGVR